MTARFEAVAALDRQWRTAAEIHARVHCWAPTTIATQLNQAAVDGEIVRERREIAQGFVWVYKLKGE